MRRKPMRMIQGRIDAEKYDALQRHCKNGDNLSDLLRDAVDMLLVSLKPKTKRAKKSVQGEAKEVAKSQGRIKCDGIYIGEGARRKCRMSENGYCIKSPQPLSCPKLSKEKMDEMRGKKGVSKKEEK